jgi:hypothetical protein
MKWMPFSFLLILSLASACKTEPAVPPAAEVEVVSEITPAPEEVIIVEDEAFFDPQSITEEVFNATKLDVQEYIGELNKIIRAKDYDSWVSNLGPEYFAHISSPAYLDQISDSVRLKALNIRVTTPQEYFSYVVVPSRANDRVDDIEFVSQKRVKAFTVIDRTQRLRLYDLELIDNGWKIIN